jgi:hypothetical protein
MWKLNISLLRTSATLNAPFLPSIFLYILLLAAAYAKGISLCGITSSTSRRDLFEENAWDTTDLLLGSSSSMSERFFDEVSYLCEMVLLIFYMVGGLISKLLLMYLLSTLPLNDESIINFVYLKLGY